VHGLIFTGFKTFVASEYPDVSEWVWEGAPKFLATSAYSDEQFEEMLAKTVQLTGDPRRVVLRRFGIFTATSTFRLLYPAYYASHSSTVSFLLDIEQQIHEVVRRTVPGSAPPRLDVKALTTGGVSITYTSPRMLCELLEGLLVGVSRYYGEEITIDQPLCMHRGDEAGCTFFVGKA